MHVLPALNGQMFSRDEFPILFCVLYLCLDNAGYVLPVPLFYFLCCMCAKEDQKYETLRQLLHASQWSNQRELQLNPLHHTIPMQCQTYVLIQVTYSISVCKNIM